MNGSEAKRPCLFAQLVALALMVGLAGGCASPDNGESGQRRRETTSTEAESPTAGTDSATSTALPDVTRAAASVGPSVVSVTVFRDVRGTEMPSGNGSGIVIREGGFLLTNEHVVRGASKVEVTAEETDYEAEVVGRDAATDLAVLKVDERGLEPAVIGDPQELQVGQWVIAVGYPFGLDQSVTLGIVSGLGRTTVQPTEDDVAAYTNLIQTDASINPGNSGGALVDLDGRVVGVNALIESDTGGSSGIGFAIPIDFALDVAEQLIEDGTAEHAFLGVGVSSVGGGMAPGTGTGEGAVVESVEQGSPADEAGLREGDVVVRIGETSIDNASDVFAAVRSHKPGDSVEIEVTRDGDTERFEATLSGRASEESSEDTDDGSPDGFGDGMPDGFGDLPPGHP